MKREAWVGQKENFSLIQKVKSWDGQLNASAGESLLTGVANEKRDSRTKGEEYIVGTYTY